MGGLGVAEAEVRELHVRRRLEVVAVPCTETSQHFPAHTTLDVHSTTMYSIISSLFYAPQTTHALIVLGYLSSLPSKPSATHVSAQVAIHPGQVPSCIPGIQPLMETRAGSPPASQMASATRPWNSATVKEGAIPASSTRLFPTVSRNDSSREGAASGRPAHPLSDWDEGGRGGGT